MAEVACDHSWYKISGGSVGSGWISMPYRVTIGGCIVCRKMGTPTSSGCGSIMGVGRRTHELCVV